MFTVKYRKREIDRTLTKAERDRKNVRELADFYRQNADVFIKDYLGIKTLTWWQEMWMCAMFKYSTVVICATRGLGKSFLISLFLVAYCMLYPRTKVVLASSTKFQARLLCSQYILGQLWNSSSAIRRAINLKESKTSINDTYILFKNGSSIIVATSSEGSRGRRVCPAMQ